ncbi:MICOS complex subunit MIC60 [Novosphingobium sp. B 225]|uniref:MICOS complex subunit MIC60 n=1 Tax=Novosphingobium sp. B 225 TaxID=1961849 RepID=UPI0020CC2781|nr:MICOS complex subunit MIC60 [Novosphingobium sp. B 225]
MGSHEVRMSDEFFDRPLNLPPRRKGPGLRMIGTTLLLAFLAGGAVVGWLAWSGKIQIGPDLLEPAKPAASAPFAALPSPAPAASPGSVTAGPTTAGAVDGFDQRLAALEQRLARLDLQAAAAEGNTTRAEALLVAFASRRAIERGAPLGPLADQLKLRFGNSQPNAVATLIDSAAKPNTLDLLAGQLDALESVLTQAPTNEDGWARVKRELSGLFVIRHDETPMARPENRLDRARLLLRTGQIDAAIKEVQTMPGAAGAKDWLGSAQRYAMAQRALDLIETTALLEPVKPKEPSPSPTPSASVVPEGAI